jgi:hypothetical protein
LAERVRAPLNSDLRPNMVKTMGGILEPTLFPLALALKKLRIADVKWGGQMSAFTALGTNIKDSAKREKKFPKNHIMN